MLRHLKIYTCLCIYYCNQILLSLNYEINDTVYIVWYQRAKYYIEKSVRKKYSGSLLTASTRILNSAKEAHLYYYLKFLPLPARRKLEEANWKWVSVNTMHFTKLIWFSFFFDIINPRNIAVSYSTMWPKLLDFLYL